jgi:GT2 family glycosyltransferase
MSSLANPTISVVIPVYNGGEDFRKCLTSLAQAVPRPDEVIVVADGDTDGSSNLAKAFGVRVLRNPVRSGPARARNLGARAARGDVLFFLDADVLVPPGIIGQVESVFRCSPDVAAVIGSYDDAPTATNFLSQYKNLFHHYVHQISHTEASTFWGACGVIQRQVFLALDGFDESYRQPSIEDIELGYRLKKAGHRIQLCKTLQVKHLKRWRVGSLLKTDFFRRALPWTELILRDRRFVNDLNLQTSSRFSVMLSYALLGALIGAFLWLPFLIIAGVSILLLLTLNAPLYRFFVRQRGIPFALQAIPWHWLYYLYSGLALAIGVVCYLPGWMSSRGLNSPPIWGDRSNAGEDAEWL